MTARPGAFDSDLSIQAAGPIRWKLIAPMIWTGTRGQTFIVPLGFNTDFASVPRVLHWLVLPYGPYTRAAVLHDWLLRILKWWYRLTERQRAGEAITRASAPDDVRDLIFGAGSRLLPAPPVSSRDIDGIFRRAMEDLGTPGALRWIMWAAVRWSSLTTPSRRNWPDFLGDAPQVLALTLVAGVVVLPGVAGVLISLGIVRLAGSVGSSS